MKIIVRWIDGEIDSYGEIDAISHEGKQVVLVSNTVDDIALDASQIKTIEIGGFGQ